MAILNILKYEGDNRTLFYRHPAEDFSSYSKLIVHASQEAFLLVNGSITGRYPAGEYALTTINPLAKPFLSLLYGGTSPCHAEVYFVNKAAQLPMRWGVNDIAYRDPVYDKYTWAIGASGDLVMSIDDAEKALLSLVGTDTGLDQAGVMAYYKPMICQCVKEHLPNLLSQDKLDIFSVETDLKKRSEELRSRLEVEVGEHGLKLTKFILNSIQKPITDGVYHQLNALLIGKTIAAGEGEIRLVESGYEAKSAVALHQGEIEMKKLDLDMVAQYGAVYEKHELLAALRDQARNEGQGNLAAELALMGHLSSEMASGGLIPKKATEGSDTFQSRLDRLVMMKKAGLLSDEEYEQKCIEILNSI